MKNDLRNTFFNSRLEDFSIFFVIDGFNKKESLARQQIENFVEELFTLVNPSTSSSEFITNFKQLDKSFSMVNAYACNRIQPNLETLQRIAEILQVDLKDLITDKEER